jgi:hypothetical protein
VVKLGLDEAIRIFVDKWGEGVLSSALFELMVMLGCEDLDDEITAEERVKALLGRVTKDELIRHLWDRGNLDEGIPAEVTGLPSIWANRKISKKAKSGSTVKIKGVVQHFTYKAILLHSPDDNRPIPEWFPLSQLLSSNKTPEVGETVIFTVSSWLAKKKGIPVDNDDKTTNTAGPAPA